VANLIYKPLVLEPGVLILVGSFQHGVTKEAKAKAYLIILQGLARDHYYTNLRRVAQTLPFDQLYNTTQNYCKRPEYQRSVLNK
jgi:hypothetical protein